MITETIAAVKAGIHAYRAVKYSEKFNRRVSSVGESASGAIVNEETVFNIATAYSCVNIISQTIGSLPLKVYRRMDEGRETANKHYLYDVLHNRPNPYMIPSAFKECVQASVLTWGNGYAEIELDRAGRVLHLWPIYANRVTPRLIDGVLYYDVHVSNEDTQRLPAEKIFHVPGLSFNGISGTTPIQKSRESFGQALAAQEYGSRYFKNDANPGGVLKHPQSLSDEAFKRLKKTISENHEGLSNKHRFMLLEEGMSWEKVGLSPQDSQMLETTKYSGTQISGMFRVPPHMVGLLDRATFSNIEQQSIEFLTGGIYPWTKKWEEAIGLRLFMDFERPEYYAEFISDGYLRGDIAARTSYYSTGIQNGWLSVNDIRRKENMNPVAGGDKYFRQLNLTALDAPNGGIVNEN